MSPYLHILKYPFNNRVCIHLEPLPSGAVARLIAPCPAVGFQQLLEGIDCGGGAGHGQVGDEGRTVHHGDEGAVKPPPPNEHLKKRVMSGTCGENNKGSRNGEYEGKY